MPKDMAAYMRERRALGLDKSRPPTGYNKDSARLTTSWRGAAGHAQHVPGHHTLAGPQEHRDELNRHARRDGGVMWPERVMTSETPYSDGLREIDAAEKRRRNPAAPAPIKQPAPRPKTGANHYGKTGKRAFEKVA